MTYADKLKDPRWQKRRLEILSRDEFRCTNENCQSETEELHVHHRYYVKGLEPWEYPDSALATLCKTCHSTTEHMWQFARVTLGHWDYGALNMLIVAAGELGEMSGHYLLDIAIKLRNQTKETTTVS